MTTDRFSSDETGAYLVVDRHPVLLPPKLARLIEHQMANPRRTSQLPPATTEHGAFIFPGRTSRPRNPEAFAQRLRDHDLPTLAARNTAMIENVAELPPVVVSDLFGIHINTANAWAGYAQDSWADYLAAQVELRS
ncbi:hypothetical protein [Streptomyces venezuelae]|uniref:hypothetical protein n=1 Tax=Streptomyces venezuelae TaxID=54571 RepID=UPI001689B484|nr:hypothetical protein [Streptomyces venezuelae]